MLLVKYQLPSPENMPKYKEHKYVMSTDDVEPVALSELERNKLFDQDLYQVILRSLYELFDSDVIEALDSIVFNGHVWSIDKGTGKEINPCILTVQANRKKFLEVNLRLVEAKACFKQLKGIGRPASYTA